MPQTQIASLKAQPVRAVQPPFDFHSRSSQPRTHFFAWHTPAVSLPADGVTVCHLAHDPHAQDFSQTLLSRAEKNHTSGAEKITDRLLEPRPGSLRGALDGLRAFATARLASLRKLISSPESVHQSRALMAEQFGKLTLTPVNENGIVSYATRGKVDFFGEEAMIRVGGAGGPALHDSATS